MILTSLNRFRDLGLLVLRVGLGLVYIYRGLPDLLGLPEFLGDVAFWSTLRGRTPGIPTLHEFWGFMAEPSEAVVGLFLILGFFFRPAALFMFLAMAAVVSFYLGEGGSLDVASHAVEVGIVFLSLVLIGPGKYSLDEVIRPSKNPKP